jgi:hypothetical protein
MDTLPPELMLKIAGYVYRNAEIGPYDREFVGDLYEDRIRFGRTCRSNYNRIIFHRERFKSPW